MFKSAIIRVDTDLGKLQEIVRTGRLGMLRSMGSQRVGHDRAAEQPAQTRVGVRGPELGSGGECGCLPGSR